MTFFLCAGVTLLMLLAITGVSAQDGTTRIPSGEAVVITLDADMPSVRLGYESRGDETVRVAARDLATGEAPVDTVIRVIAPDGHEIAYADHNPGDDDTLAESDAVLPVVTLREPGMYTLWISSYGEIGVGDVAVSLNVVDAFAAETDDTADGVRVAARLPEGRVFVYEIDAAPGSLVITARDTGGTLDPRLTLRDESGAVIAVNDDHASDDLTLNAFDARVVVEIESAGTLTITVSDFLARAGTFELTVQGESNP